MSSSSMTPPSAQVVAIDGPAASGKSSAARGLAKKLYCSLVNTGAMYRAVTRWVLNTGLDPLNHAQVQSALPFLPLSFGLKDGQSWVAENGQILTDADLSRKEVNDAVSLVAQIPAVRTLLVQKQRDLGHFGDLVMEGRDIGSTVFPNTPFKFYINASEEVRNARRRAQGLTDQIAERDRLDATRQNAPLVISESAQVIDSSNLSLDQVVEELYQHCLKLGWILRSPSSL